ncbi:hypothetical protein [Acidianus sp. HS-5]|uniref:hypothetical protein n=1 Tax=Acidianus sp. HS-5 TaxID=2886040 RepID=UPI001F1E09A4|nr:hypothetical protein [Acidianus sp. HS-5]BDC18550.1 hypothetical protein HS5_14400 [Acidianus sp. HS-5]
MDKMIALIIVAVIIVVGIVVSAYFITHSSSPFTTSISSTCSSSFTTPKVIQAGNSVICKSCIKVALGDCGGFLTVVGVEFNQCSVPASVTLTSGTNHVTLPKPSDLTPISGQTYELTRLK